MRFQKVTLLVPADEADRDPADWDWQALSDTPMPVLSLSNEDVEPAEAADLYEETGYESEAKYVRDVWG